MKALSHTRQTDLNLNLYLNLNMVSVSVMFLYVENRPIECFCTQQTYEPSMETSPFWGEAILPSV